MPLNRMRAQRKFLNPNMGRVRRLIARWSCPMVLLDEVVQIFGLADLDGRFTIGIDGFERSEIGAAFVYRHRLGDTILSDRFLKVTPGSLSRCARNRKSMVLPSLSTAR